MGFLPLMARARIRLLRLQIAGRRLAGPSIGLDFVADLLPIREPGQSSALDRRNVHENIQAALIGLNEAITLLAVEPLHGTCSHVTIPARLPERCPPSHSVWNHQLAWGQSDGEFALRVCCRAGHSWRFAHVAVLIDLSHLT